MPEPFAEPDLPARDRLHRHHLHLVLLDVSRQCSARQPERGKAQQRRNDAERVGQQDLRETARGTIVLDDQRQK